MITINHTRLRMSGALNIEHLTALKLHIGVNTHGWAVVEGEAGETALEQLSGALAGREQHILTLDESGAEKCLFAGVIREAELVRVGGYNRFHVELLSGTCLMDREVRSRSFQDVDRTYSQVAQQVCSEYSGGAAICTAGEDKTLAQPVIQYRETDWEFLMRMASHCGGVLVPETHRGLPRLWFGFPDRSFTCEFPEDAYTSGISQRYYELGGSAAGYSKADFFYYDVESPRLCDLGWYTIFKGQPFIISEKYAILERGELIFTYRLGRPGLGWGKMLYNEKISGMTLLGEVLETSRETLKLKLDIDAGWNPGGPYPYTWRPETGNFMYCMPQVGTRVSLYCPNYDEKTAIAVNCVRTYGGDCDRMSDPSKRSFVTEHGKEMNLYPSEMSLIGGSNGLFDLSDEDGITVGSEKPVVIIAYKEVKFEAAQVVTQALVGEIVAAKGDPVTGDVDSSLVMCNNYDIVAQNVTKLEGWNCVPYGPYNDAPEESSFDLSGLVFAAIGIVAAVAVVGALSLTGIGAFLVGGLVAGVVTGALCASKAASDAGLTGLDYWKAVGLGALTGGIKGLAAGAALALAPYAAEVFVASYLPIGLMVGGTYITTAALTTIGAYGLGTIATIYAGLKANDVMALSGTNYVQALTGISDETYNTINSGVTALGSFIITMGMANPRAWSDLKNNQSTINDVLVQGRQDIAGLLGPKLTPEQQAQRQAVADVNSGKVVFTNNRKDNVPKGNYGEMVTDIDLESAGYTRVNTGRVTSLSDPTHQGIDGVYKCPSPPPDYIIVESKYDTSTLSTLTSRIKQMSSPWIYGQRLDSAVGVELADEIRMLYYNNPQSVQSVLANISPSGSISYSSLDAGANIIGQFFP